jgi:putative ABC transport system permease protein
MFFHHIRPILRSLQSQLGQTILNVIGLAVGLSACFLIAAYVYDDLAWDGFHENGDRIYRVNAIEKRLGAGEQTNAYTPAPFAPAFMEQIPEVESATRVMQWRPLEVLGDDGEVIAEGRGYVADENFFRVFGYELLLGDPDEVLKGVNSVVLSDNLAKKIFGDEHPVGKTIRAKAFDEPQVVTGVFSKPAEGSHLDFDALQTLKQAEKSGMPLTLWQASFLATYVLLTPNADLQRVEATIGEVVGAHLQGTENRYQLEPMKRLHLHSGHISTQINDGQSNVIYVYTLVSLAVFILLIATVNYVNLATAQSLQRTRMVGLRKILGASRWQLFVLNLGEAFVICLAAAVISVILVELIQPSFETVTGRPLHLQVLTPLPLITFLLLALFVGALSGIYPAMLVSSLKPTQLIGSRHTGKHGSQWIRRSLVGLQFTISIGLIIITLITLRQLDYLRTKPLGFNAEGVVAIYNNHPEFWQNELTLKQKFREVPGVTAVGATWNAPGMGRRQATVEPAGLDEEYMVDLYSADANSFDALGFELAEGRYFSEDRPGDIPHGEGDVGAAVINETVAKQLGWEHPIGKRMRVLNNQVEVIGVIKDFHQYSLHDPIEPTVLVNYPEYRDFLIIRYNTKDVSGLVKNLESTFAEITPNLPMHPYFLDERFEAMYEGDRRFALLMNIFAGLAIALACFGLLGLTARNVVSRKREIGIRKVLGASPSHVLTLLGKELMLLVVAANIVAWPIAFRVMEGWLSNFAFRTTIPISIFPIAGLIAFIIAATTVLFMALRALRLNPSNVLRDE